MTLPGDRLIADAITLYESGDSAGALKVLETAIAAGVSDADSIELFLALSNEVGETGHGLEAAEHFLEDARIDISPVDQARVRTAVLLTSIGVDLHGDELGRRLLSTIEAVAAAGSSGWSSLDNPVLRELVLDHLVPSRLGLDLAEQLQYAPAHSEWPAIALQQIETIGTAPVRDRGLARASEKLLHAAGKPDAAYRVERQRRSRSSKANSTERVRHRRVVASLQGVTVAVAGGHPALRATAGREISALGGAMREIPSRFESVRRDRDILGALQGADVAIVIVSQIAHSTSDQVARAAKRLGVPVINVRSASASAIVSAATRWRSKGSLGPEV